MLIFFFNDTATTEIYTLSLHDALPILASAIDEGVEGIEEEEQRIELLAASERCEGLDPLLLDRKSTRLNSSHQIISYAVFCLKKKNMSSTRHSRVSTAQWTCLQRATTG